MPLPSGTRLGAYEVLSQIGAGGMGEVYKGRDPKLARLVAIKVLPAHLAASGDQLARFEREARAVAALNHPNILGIYDFGREGQTAFAVMELLEGETLRERLRAGAMAPRKALEIAQQIADGLASAHARGIVHRDLKPENVFLTREGRVKVLDFGLAKQVHEWMGGDAADQDLSTQAVGVANAGTEAGVVLGTVGYMAPEQVRGLPADHRSDVFAFGAVLYEMLSGRRAFAGESAVQTLHAILVDGPAGLSGTRAQISPALERLVFHCLEKEPESRYQSFKDLSFELQSLSTTSSFPAPLAKARVARGRWGWLAAGVAVSIALGLLLWALDWPPFRPPAQPTFQRLTFRRGNVTRARLVPGERSIVYTANLDGRGYDTYLAVPGSPESRSLGLPNAQIRSVSTKGELAIVLAKVTGAGILARMPMFGGAPRELLEDVSGADWAPDGQELAAVHWVNGRARLEYPIGTVWCDLPHGADVLRISPSGQEVAWVEVAQGVSRIQVLDRGGRRWTLPLGAGSISGLAWAEDGRSLITSWGPNKLEHSLWQVPLQGTARLLLRIPKGLNFMDADAQGRVLVEVSSDREETLLQTGDAPPRDISWMTDSVVVAVGQDGEPILYWGRGEASGPRGASGSGGSRRWIRFASEMARRWASSHPMAGGCPPGRARRTMPLP